MKLRIPLNSGDMQPKDVKVTIRGRGELLLEVVEHLKVHDFARACVPYHRTGSMHRDGPLGSSPVVELPFSDSAHISLNFPCHILNYLLPIHCLRAVPQSTRNREDAAVCFSFTPVWLELLWLPWTLGNRYPASMPAAIRLWLELYYHFCSRPSPSDNGQPGYWP